MRDYKLTLNIITNDKVEEKMFKQFDTGNEIELEVLENENLREDKKLELSNQTVLAFFKRADGQVLQKNCTIKNGNIIVKTSKDVLGVPGKLELECLIKENDIETTTTRMVFDVKESIARDKAITKDERYTSDLVTELLDIKAETKDKIAAIGNKTDKNETQISSLKDAVENNVYLIKYDSTITDYSQVLIAAMSNIEGKTFVFEAGKEYPFTKQIDINGMKNCTIDFRNAILKDMGQMMDVIDCYGSNPKKDSNGNFIVVGQEKNPLGIRFTNFENLTIKNLILDSVDMPVSPKNYRISHNDVIKKRANICFATGRNLEFINSEFRCGQGTYIQGGYVQGDETRLPNQLEFFMSKMYNVKNIIFKNILYNGKSKTEIFGFGKCNHIVFEGIEKQSDNLVSFFKMLQCEDVKIKGIDYINPQDYSLADISGTNYVIENVNIDYKKGKAFDITNEWGLGGGKLGDFTYKNCNIDADKVAFMGMHSYKNIKPYPYIEPADNIVIENCILGHDGKREEYTEEMSVASNRGSIINFVIRNSVIYNMHIIKSTISWDQQLVDNFTTAIENCTYIINDDFSIASDKSPLVILTMYGKSNITNTIFKLNNRRLLLRDGLIKKSDSTGQVTLAPKDLDDSYTFIQINNCEFNNGELNLNANMEFRDCIFNDCKFRSWKDGEHSRIKFINCTFKFNKEKYNVVYSSDTTTGYPMHFRLASELEFFQCKFLGDVRVENNSFFLTHNYGDTVKIKFKDCIFDVARITDNTASQRYQLNIFDINNYNGTTDTNDMDLLIDSCEFRNYSVPLMITGNSVDIEERRNVGIVMKNCISTQSATNYSVKADSTRLYYTSINLTLKNNEMTLYRAGVNENGIGISEKCVFKKLINQGNTGIVV